MVETLFNPLELPYRSNKMVSCFLGDRKELTEEKHKFGAGAKEPHRNYFNLLDYFSY